MKVLVTGAQGYIGSVLIAELKRRNHEVVAYDAGFFAQDHLYDAPTVHEPYIRKDVRQMSEEDVRGVDAVVHLGELSNDPLGELDPTLTFEINYGGSLHLAKLCKRAKIPRFVYSSSCSVYGIASSEIVDEQSPTNPQTVYAECKVLVEREVAALADDDFSPTFLRNATAYGPSPRFRFDLVLNNLAGAAKALGEIRLTSDGSPWRPLVHVEDICRAFLCVLEAPRELVHNQVFNVGDTLQNYRVREIAEIVAEAFPGVGISFGEGGKDTRSYRVSFDKIRDALPSFRCLKTAQEGARELRDLFEKLRLTRGRFEDRAFTRIKQIRYLLETKQVDSHLFWLKSQGIQQNE